MTASATAAAVVVTSSPHLMRMWDKMNELSSSRRKVNQRGTRPKHTFVPIYWLDVNISLLVRPDTRSVYNRNELISAASTSFKWDGASCVRHLVCTALERLNNLLVCWFATFSLSFYHCEISGERGRLVKPLHCRCLAPFERSLENWRYVCRIRDIEWAITDCEQPRWLRTNDELGQRPTHGTHSNGAMCTEYGMPYDAIIGASDGVRERVYACVCVCAYEWTQAHQSHRIR